MIKEVIHKSKIKTTNKTVQNNWIGFNGWLISKKTPN